MNVLRVTEGILAFLAIVAFLAILGLAGWIDGMP